MTTSRRLQEFVAEGLNESCHMDADWCTTVKGNEYHPVNAMHVVCQSQNCQAERLWGSTQRPWICNRQPCQLLGCSRPHQQLGHQTLMPCGQQQALNVQLVDGIRPAVKVQIYEDEGWRGQQLEMQRRDLGGPVKGASQQHNMLSSNWA